MDSYSTKNIPLCVPQHIPRQQTQSIMSAPANTTNTWPCFTYPHGVQVLRGNNIASAHVNAVPQDIMMVTRPSSFGMQLQHFNGVLSNSPLIGGVFGGSNVDTRHVYNNPMHCPTRSMIVSAPATKQAITVKRSLAQPGYSNSPSATQTISDKTARTSANKHTASNFVIGTDKVDKDSKVHKTQSNFKEITRAVRIVKSVY